MVHNSSQWPALNWKKVRRSLPLGLFLFQGEFLDTHIPEDVLRADQVYRDLENEKSHDDDDDD